MVGKHTIPTMHFAAIRGKYEWYFRKIFITFNGMNTTLTARIWVIYASGSF